MGGQAGLGVVQVFTQLAQRRVDRPFLASGSSARDIGAMVTEKNKAATTATPQRREGRAHPAYRLGRGKRERIMATSQTRK